MVLKLTSNFCIELRFYSVLEALEYRGNLKFISDKEELGKMGMIINKGHKPPLARGGSNL